jgi:hypothetical protein
MLQLGYGAYRLFWALLDTIRGKLRGTATPQSANTYTLRSAAILVQRIKLLGQIIGSVIQLRQQGVHGIELGQIALLHLGSTQIDQFLLLVNRFLPAVQRCIRAAMEPLLLSSRPSAYSTAKSTIAAGDNFGDRGEIGIRAADNLLSLRAAAGSGGNTETRQEL